MKPKDPKQFVNPSHLGGVAIVGARRNFLCKRNHLERAPVPFTMGIPGPDGKLQTFPLCRTCWSEFLLWLFPVMEISDEDADRLVREEKEAQAAAAAEANGGAP